MAPREIRFDGAHRHSEQSAFSALDLLRSSMQEHTAAQRHGHKNGFAAATDDARGLPDHSLGSGRPGSAYGAEHQAPQVSRHDVGQGMIRFTGLKGCRVDTDGSGAWRHPEDEYRRRKTDLTVNGRYLDTDHDKYVALPPNLMAQYGLQVGDKGYLVRSDTGKAVPVVFGDSSPEKHWRKGEPEASLAALRALGFRRIAGNSGVDKNVAFELIMAPGSANTMG